jgi:hypothetical protein
MSRFAVLTFLLAGTGIFTLACGATPPPQDGGFGFGFGSGTGGQGAAGYPSGAGGFSGAGGSTSTTGGNPEPERRDGGDRAGGERDKAGGGGGDRNPGVTADAGAMAACPAGARTDSPCSMSDTSCSIAAGDAGRAQVCVCEADDDVRLWQCERR